MKITEAATVLLNPLFSILMTQLHLYILQEPQYYAIQLAIIGILRIFTIVGY